jgi:2-polyprenyl-6-methoxyphenol hydroxylase-like FAD-dependent oxidoreductase
MNETDVLVVGAGPVGLTAALELRRHGLECRIVEKLAQPAPYAKAVGIQPRTLEIWAAMDCAREAAGLAVPIRGQIVFVNGEETARVKLELPANVPWGFAALPQYETERLLADQLVRRGTRVERGVELTGFEADAEGVTARLRRARGEKTLRARYLLGCDGAHSLVRTALGLAFEGDAFPEQYMLGDVEVDWRLPAGFAIRASRSLGAGKGDDLLVCIPLPGRKRYRMSMLVPPELAIAANGGDGVAHGLEGGRRPELRHIQAVLDRLSPERPVTVRNLRWSSVFRISHRLVERYSMGRVFLAGDAAHIHPPTGAQGMNTGIQDAYNLVWKLALVVKGATGEALLASYDAERRPVGEEVVGRTVRHAREGLENDPESPATIMQREAQLLLNYRTSPIVVPSAKPGPGGPAAGDRAPDCGGLRHPIAAFAWRLFELLKRPGHSLLLYADEASQLDRCRELAELVRSRAAGVADTCAILAPELDADAPALPAVVDARGEFRVGYAARGGDAFLVRPDGYLGARLSPADKPSLNEALDRIFAR